MQMQLFASTSELLTGLTTGILFGFFLRKGAVTRFSTIIGQLLLKDFTVLKVILTAIAVGGLSIYSSGFLLEEKEPILSSTSLFAAALGGGIFGLGMAILGYCPGTCVGAFAERTKDAFFGIVGMILGAGLYAEFSSWIIKHLKAEHQINKSTLMQYFGVSPWILLGAIFSLLTLLIFTDLVRKMFKQMKSS